jgi:hypothetical protein
MAKQSRNVLKNFFKNGNLLSQSEFSDLIDSSWNINDDGMNRTNEEGLQLGPVGASQKIISFYKNNIDENPQWQLAIDFNQSNGLSFVRPGKEHKPALFLGNNGKMGIETIKPMAKLHVEGSVASESRVGVYKVGKVKADAEWHTILSDLKDCTVFEIVAQAKGNIGDGNYTMAHAVAINANQGKNGKIKVIKSSFRWFDIRDKILFRWQGEPTNYSLQIRTGKHYFLTNDKKDCNYLKFHVCKLWDDGLNFDLIHENA